MRTKPPNGIDFTGVEMKRINQQESYSLDGACTNMTEEIFIRLRRAEIGSSPYRPCVLSAGGAELPGHFAVELS
jgi:hypothetical protein